MNSTHDNSVVNVACVLRDDYRYILLCVQQAVREAATICPRPLQVGNIFVFIRQVAGLFRHVGYLRHQQQVDLWPFDLESGVRVSVTWATSMPILVFLGLSVLDLGPMSRQMSDAYQRLTPPTYHHRHQSFISGDRGIISSCLSYDEVQKVCAL